MAVGKRKAEQQELWVATTDLPRSPGHPFYLKLNALLAEDGFDAWLEALCAPYYHEKLGRPSIPPGVYFRMVLIGYFEGIASQRGIAWRCCDSRSLAAFLGFGPTQDTPDHSSLSRVAQRLPLEVHDAVFQRVLAIAVTKKLVHGKTAAVDSTTLEANAAMKSIVRRDDNAENGGENWKEYVTGLMREAGVIAADETPTDEEARRFDKGRKDKKVSNAEWVSTTDEESRITRMKDGTTHLAYKAEHVLDVESEFLLAVTLHGGDAADTDTLCDSLIEAQMNLQAAGSDVEVREGVADKGYHAAATIELCESLHFRTYIPEPQRKHRARWNDKAPELRDAVYANRRRAKGERGKKLGRLRSERVERSFAHLCETGGARRCWLAGLEKVTKRYLLQAASRNLGLILRKLFGNGTPRGRQQDAEGKTALTSLAQIAIAACQILINTLQAARNAIQRTHNKILAPRPQPAPAA